MAFLLVGLISCHGTILMLLNYYKQYEVGEGGQSSIKVDEWGLNFVDVTDMEQQLCLRVVNSDLHVIPCSGACEGSRILLVDYV